MRKAARQGDEQERPSGSHGSLQDPCEPMVLIHGVPAARLATRAVGSEGVDLVTSGAAMVLIHGLPAARMGDATTGGGVVIGPGADRVLFDGPEFSVPSVVEIEGDDAYRSKVIRDLYFISTTRSGREWLARLERAGQNFRPGGP